MKIALGCDHVAVDLKKMIIDYIVESGMEYTDFGTFEQGVRVDYPDYGLLVAEAVASGEYDRGILICGTGVGISLAANKVPGIRAVVCSEPYTALLSRQHNDTNILAMGARVVGPDLALMIVKEWMSGEFEGGRHQTRVDKLKAIESKYNKVENK